MSTALTTIPPYRQSLAAKMGCEHCYKLTEIDGVKYPDTPESERGSDVHAVLAPYARHCALKKVPADFAYLESLCKAIGEEAFEILETCRDNLTIDWENFFGAEIPWGLDSRFRPTWSFDHDGKRLEIDPVWGIEGSGDPPVVCGIMDVLYLFPGGVFARLPDYKSHFRAFAADTEQAQLYCLAAMMHLPELKEVEFSLRFVRFENIQTAHKYSREDVPALMDFVRRKNEQKELIHIKVANGEPLRVHSGPQCTYCPSKLEPTRYPCPIEPLNPMLNRTPQEWLQVKMVIDQMKTVADKTLRQIYDSTREPIRTEDANGKVFEFGPKEHDAVTVPLFEKDGKGGFIMPALDALIDYAGQNPDDLVPKRRGSEPWFCNLEIGWTGLKKYLKAKKRVDLHQKIMDLATVTKEQTFRVKALDPELDTRSDDDAERDEEMCF